MVAPSGPYHKRNEDGNPLCGSDQLGYMWIDKKQVTCRACQLILRHPEIETTAKELAKEYDDSE